MKKTALVIIFLLLIIGSFVLWKISKNSTRNDLSSKIPQGSYLREVKDIPGVKGVKLIAYIDNPNFEDKFDLGNITSCPGSTMGQAIDGIYHLALVKDGNLYGDIIMPAYSYEDNKVDSRQKLAFKNTKANAYYYFGGEKFNGKNENDPVDVQLVQFGSFTDNDKLIDFSITGPTSPCSHTYYLHGGYDIQNNKLVFYPIMEGNSKYYWGDSFRPFRGGGVFTEWRCGDHGSETYENNYYQFESTASAYILSTSERGKCN